ncbi:MAG: isoprenylcysteine carboxylmethyltransferase family protein [Deltaproteobacteria bacterium]|nr:isoprenylcysteine carboxylmethyltransferase family protein [Deltaproteobacteria bacterium]
MARAQLFFASRLVHFVTAVSMGSLYVIFAAAHIAAFSKTGKVQLLFLVVSEAVLAALFVFRTPPKDYARSPVVWLIAAVGAYLPLGLRPTSLSMFPGADWGVAVGTAMQMAGLLSLNRSFAIVPALRKIKTGGLYRWVRHPIYASYFLLHTSYVAGNLSLRNVAIWLLVSILLIVRLHLEEEHLSADPAYLEYRSRVRWRLFPFLY